MKIGIAGITPGRENKVRIMKEIGYDFIESGLCYYYDEFEQAQINEFADYLKELDMPCLSTNGMFPGDIKLIGKEADRVRISEYLHEVFEKTACLNVPVCVLGSGNARRIPEGCSLDACYDEFSELCADVIAPILEKHGKTLAIEPLNYSECNIVNTVADSMRVVKAVNKPSVMTLIDLYHVRYNGEDINTFTDYKGYIKHVHVASYPNNRRFPRPYDGENYKAFFDVLRRAGYGEGNVSIEGSVIDDGLIAFKNAAISAYSLLKQL